MRTALLPVTLAALLAAPAPTPSAYRTDMNHSTVGFSVPILGGLSRVTGKFSRFRMDFDYDEADPSRSKVNATIYAASIDTGIDERDAHLEQDDFFAAATYPEIVFESMEVSGEGDRLSVIGVLTVRDESRDVELDVRVLREADGTALGFHATTSIDRQDYGIRYKHGDIPDFIGDRVDIELFILTHPRP